MDTIEKIARIYCKFEGFDPDSVHFDIVIEGNKPKLMNSGKKKWEIYKGKAEANIEIFKLLKEQTNG